MDLGNLILSHIKSNQQEIYTTLPGKVIALRKTQESTTVDVQILINKVDAANTVEEEPELYDVPLQYPSSGGCFITLPIDVGDLVTLHFSMRALGTYMNGDGDSPKSPSNKRLHNAGDVFAAPPILPYQLGREIDSKALVASSGATEIRILRNGTIELGEGATEKLVLGDSLKAYLDSLMQAILTHSHTVSGSATTATAFTAPTGEYLSEVNKTK